RGKSINRLRSIANVIATKSLYSTPSFGLFFCSRDVYKSIFCYKKIISNQYRPKPEKFITN
ncbi:hypothetical protein, partial [Yersinia rochesterensis]|uniref:hypothetical protein n=1 Tax=Yersinia rochesterensis TaxID=1604335 RepID=UPI001C95FFBC